MWFGAQGGLLPPTAYAGSLPQGWKRQSRGERINSFKLNHGMTPRHAWQGLLTWQLAVLQGRHGPASPRALPRTCGIMAARLACTPWEIPILPCWTMSLLGQEFQKPQILKASSPCPAHSRLPEGHPASLCQCSREQKQELPLFSQRNPSVLLCSIVPSTLSQKYPATDLWLL